MVTNNQIDTFSGSAHWIGDNHLCFMERNYFVRIANEKRLIFGKMNENTIGDNGWEYTFDRLE